MDTLTTLIDTAPIDKYQVQLTKDYYDLAAAPADVP